jgi:Spy/CpxP family protein refolding chaperone
MKNRTLFGTLILLLGFVFTLAAQSGPPMGMDKPPMHQAMMDELKLNDQQKKDVDKIHSDAQKEQIDGHSEIAKARVELKDLLKADNPNQSSIEKKMNDISGLENQAQSKHLNVWFSINKLLTPDQQKVWKKTLANHGAMRGMRGQMRMGGRMGMMDRRGGMQRDGLHRNMNQPMPGSERGKRR